MRKVCVITGTRAEYGLLYWTMKSLQEDPDIELQLCVTGMHLSSEFGLTYQVIEQEGFRIDKKIEILLSSDTSVGMTKAVGLGIISFSEALAELQPDIVLLLGDRFEVLAAATAAALSAIPIAHCHGGELTEGAIDESIRHAVTKMSHLHFTSTEEYRRRVIQMGELPDRVYNVGALGIENVHKLPLLSRATLEKQLNFTLREKNIVVTYHPVTLEKNAAKEQISALLSVLEEVSDTGIIFTLPNADAESRVLIEVIKNFVADHKSNAAYYTSLGQLRYLSLLQYVDAVVGNSSSGILEAPSFNIPTINIGNRQRGRAKAESVVDCEPTYASIKEAFAKIQSSEFRSTLRQVTNPYDRGASSGRIVPVLKNVNPDELINKQFYDMELLS
ncbi:MAG: UDP-N-acetylglucosamine 2-epimerase [Cyclobacteriaceae bacterium]